MSNNFIVHGWRDINHSFSIVNQNQLYHLSKFKEIKLFHFDEKKYNENWTKTSNSANLSDYKNNIISNIPNPSINSYYNSTIYSINFPFMSYLNKGIERKIYHFVVTEFGLTCEDLIDHKEQISIFNNSNEFIITPSNWSREKIVDSGFNNEKVIIIPHGIDKENFFPLQQIQINQLRTALNLDIESFCFLNLGSMTYNKGIDLIIESYAVVFKKFPYINIIFKDQFNLYGIKAEKIINDILIKIPLLDNAELRKSIIVISDNLSSTQMNSLYNLSDCYISPYRAEGFNLPVLEAMACGCHIITTSGGSTDDFVNDYTYDWYKIESFKESNKKINSIYLNNNTNYHLSPIVENIIFNMEKAVENKFKNIPLSNYIKETYDWELISKKLIKRTIDI